MPAVVQLETTTRRRISIDSGPTTVAHEWTDRDSAARVARRIVEALKLVPDAERRRLLAEIGRTLAVDLPASPPPQYASMSWDEVRTAANGLTTYGAHTVTHPILARADDDVARHEIEESWRRLRDETTATVSVFCYPNGGANDATDRDAKILAGLGIEAAVTTRPGYASPDRWRASPHARFFLPRFPYDGETNTFAQVAAGVERAKLAIRGQS